MDNAEYGERAMFFQHSDYEDDEENDTAGEGQDYEHDPDGIGEGDDNGSVSATNAPTTNGWTTTNTLRDERTCRICRSGAEEGRPLYHPCRCRGSIRYVHEDCLLQWLSHSQSKRCELCGYAFSFTPVYAEDTPHQLSTWEMVEGLTRRTMSAAAWLLRMLGAGMVWFVAVPLTTAWLVRLYLAPALSTAPALISARLSIPAIAGDCMLGSAVCGIVVCFFMTTAAFREFMHNNADLLPPMPMPMEGVLGMGRDARRDDNDGNDENDEREGIADEAAARIREHGHILGMDNHNINNNNINNNNNDDDDDDDDVDVDDNDDIGGGAGIQEVALEELIGIEGPISTMLETVAVAFASNVLFLSAALFLPFTVGRVLAPVYWPPPADPSVIPSAYHIYTITAGYALVIGGALLSMGVSLTVHRVRQTPLDAVTRKALSVLRVVWLFAKVVGMVTWFFGGAPLLCGVLIDYLTVDMVGSATSVRLAYFKAEPVSAVFTHWMVGVAFLVQLSVSIRTLREILRPQVLWFLTNPDDPDFHFMREIVQVPIRSHLRRILYTALMFFTLAIALVRAPLKLCRNMLPGVFPLSVGFSIQSSLNLVFVWVFAQIGVNRHLNPRRVLKAFYSRWIHVAGHYLDLSSYLLPDDSPQHQQHDNINDNNTNDDDDDDDDHVYKPPLFPLRIGALLFLAWCTLLVLLSTMIALPLMTGKAMLGFMALPGFNDAYNYVAGLYTIGAILYIGKLAVGQIREQHHRLGTATLRKMLRGTVLGFHLLTLGVLWFGVVAAMTGLAFTYTFVVPVTVQANQCPLLVFSEIWGFGLFLLAVWVRMVLSLPGNLFASYRERFERIKQDGIANLQPWMILKQVVMPVFFRLGVYLVAPYLLSFYLLPIFEVDLYIQTIAFRLAYPCHLLAIVIIKGCLLWYQWAQDVHNRLRDERYLQGLRLNNLEDTRG